MLCYQSSRGVTDTVHDTFMWLRRNIRALSLCTWPILLICAVATVYVSDSIDVIGMFATKKPLDLFFKMIRPMGLFHESFDDKMVTVAYATVSAVTAMLVTPLLIRYFVDRVSLQRLTPRRYADLCADKAAPSAVVAILTASLCFALGYAGAMVVIVMLTAVGYVAPCVIMGNYRLPSGIGGWLKWLGGMAIDMAATCVVLSMPMFLAAMVVTVFVLLGMSLPGMLNLEAMQHVLTMTIVMIECLSAVGAVIFYITSSLLLHGVLVAPKQQNQA